MNQVSTAVPTQEDEARQFRRTLAMFATGVAVITAPRAEGPPIGITVASFNSVSLAPPLILFSVDRRCLSLDDLCAAGRYTVNVLDESQRETSNRFAAARGNKWDGVSFDEAGIGRLPGALAAFECEPHAQHDDELVHSVDVPFSMWYSAWNKGLPTAKKVVRKLRGSR